MRVGWKEGGETEEQKNGRTEERTLLLQLLKVCAHGFGNVALILSSQPDKNENNSRYSSCPRRGTNRQTNTGGRGGADGQTYTSFWDRKCGYERGDGRTNKHCILGF